MPPIDFLPDKYRQRDVHRKNQWSRGVVVLVFIGLLTAGSLALRQKRLAVATELDSARQTHEAAMAQTAELAKAVAKVSEARGQANLIAFLRHPWSRARIVAALTQRWPATLTLQELRICREGQATPRAYVAPLAPSPDGQAAKPPAVADLQELRRDVQSRPTVALLTGLMTDHAVLHRYLAELGKNELFSDVELLGIAPASAGGSLRFNVRLTLAPCYGQADGPRTPPTAREATAGLARTKAPPTAPKPGSTEPRPSPSSVAEFTGVAEFARIRERGHKGPNSGEFGDETDDESDRAEGSP